MAEVVRISTARDDGATEPRLVVPLDDASHVATLARELLALYPEAARVVVERGEGNPAAAS